jgi:hypothetical protein
MKSGSTGTDKELKKFESMSLSQINNEIDRCLWGARNGGTTVGRKSYFKRLIWLEKIREEKHDVEAPRRDFRKF